MVLSIYGQAEFTVIAHKTRRRRFCAQDIENGGSAHGPQIPARHKHRVHDAVDGALGLAFEIATCSCVATATAKAAAE